MLSKGNRVLKLTTLVLIGVVIIGCESTSSLYYWGSYESLIYEMYHKPGKAPPEVQIQKLQRDIQYAQSKGYKIAPGIYAHLGFMYAALGNKTAAEESFQREKALYPEAAVLLDGMMERANANAIEKESTL